MLTPLPDGKAVFRQWRHLIDGWIALLVAVCCLMLVLRTVLVLGQQVGDESIVVQNPVPASAVTPLPEPALAVDGVYGDRAGLSNPHAAARLPDGSLVVADTGNRRVVILSTSGDVLRSITDCSQSAAAPYGVAVDGDGFAVLDAGCGTIDLYGSDGQLQRHVLQSPWLVGARDLQPGPSGDVLVANPSINTILDLSATGLVTRRVTKVFGAASGQWAGVSAATWGAHGLLYALDSENNRIQALDASGVVERTWPAPASDADHPLGMLALPDGSLLSVDPSEGLLTYPPGGGPPRSLPLTVDNQPLSESGAVLGSLAPAGTRQVLVVDSAGDRVLLVRVPH